MSEHEQINEAAKGFAVGLGAALLLSQCTAAAIIAAAEERGSIDAARVFAIIGAFAGALEDGQAGPALGASAAIAAKLLRGLDPIYEMSRQTRAGVGRA